MDKDRVKGKMDDTAGRVKRQVGEWTGDKDLQAEGTAQQVKGKAENAWGKTKDAVRDLKDDTRPKEQDQEQTDENLQREPRKRDVA